MKEQHVVGTLQPCCQKPENLEVRRRHGDFVTRVCRVCSRRHITLYAARGLQSVLERKT